MLHPSLAALGGVYTIKISTALTQARSILTMQTDGEILRIRIADLMNTKRVSHISDLIFLIQRFLDNLWRRAGAYGEIVFGLLQGSFEDLHEAMRICMIMYRTSLPRSPDKYQL